MIAFSIRVSRALFDLQKSIYLIYDNSMFDIFFRLNISLRQLHQFAAVARELHFGRAAARLNMTQPPLSMAIQSLEASLGLRLFDRTNKQVSLTSAGESLLADIDRIAGDLTTAIDRTRRIAAGEEGQIRLGILPTCSILPDIVRRVKRVRPRLTLEFIEATTAEQIDMILEGRIGAGLMRPPVACPAELDHTVVTTQRLVAVLPQDHALAGLAEVPIEALRGEAFIGTPTENANGLHGHILRLTQAIGYEPEIVQIVREIPTVLALVAGGMGLSIVPEADYVTGHHDLAVRLIKVGEGSPPAEIDLWLAWMRDNRHEPFRAFLEVATQNPLPRRGR